MLSELITKNRSYRRFIEEKKLTQADLIELVRIARICPNAANLQTIRYYISTAQETNDILFDNIKWAGYLRYWDGPEPGERPTGYILIMAPANATNHHLIDTGIVAQSMLLRATEMGFGGCMIASINKDEVQARLILPEEYSISLAIAFGYPSETVVIDEVVDPDDIEYWRDDDGVHHVPKRKTEDLIIS